MILKAFYIVIRYFLITIKGWDKMNKDELIAKVKEMVNEGNLDEAKQFIEDHKDELGNYVEQAKNFLKDIDVDGITDKIKSLFK